MSDEELLKVQDYMVVILLQEKKGIILQQSCFWEKMM